MKQYTLYALIALIVVLGSFSAQAQDTVQINVRARVQKDAILLRWAASTPMAWKQTNKYGFRVERYTVVRGEVMLPQAEKKVLVQNLKPAPVKDWETIVQSNDYAAVIAQALYGESFELSGSDAQGIAKIINLSQELEQRFTLSLYAADQNFEAACMAAWGLRDTDIKKGERYLYRIVPNLPDNISIKIETGAVYVSLDEYEDLPKPVGLTAIWGDKSVMLAWDYSMLSDVYNSYFIEKSTDGKNFSRMDGIPVTNLNNKERRAAQRMYYIDSLPDNTTNYAYRVVGTSTFGEVGQASDAVSGKGKQQLSYVPSISRAVVNDKGEMELEWEFDERGNSLVKGFQLNRSDNPDKNYQAVVQNIPTDKRNLVFNGLKPSNYFTISAIPLEGEPAVSFPVLVQPVDSVPPAIPTGLKGSIDSAGVVTLTWNANKEADMYGYKVYRALTKGEEVMPLFDIATGDTVYRDTVDIRNLNSKVYYAISSVDMRYNQSDLTPIVELVKPDIIPPSSPVISGYKISDAGIEISWVNSPDEGVMQHRIYRRLKPKEDEYQLPMLLKTIEDLNILSYTDTSAVTGVRYIYTVTALKKNWKESDFSNALTAFTNKPRVQQMRIDRFDAVVDKPHRMLKLTWSDKLKEVLQYEIYKSENGQNMSLWKSVPANQYEAMDEGLYINTSYRYMIRAILKDGKNTQTKELTIKY